MYDMYKINLCKHFYLYFIIDCTFLLSNTRKQTKIIITQNGCVQTPSQRTQLQIISLSERADRVEETSNM